MSTTFYQLRPKLKLVASVLKRLLTISASSPSLMFSLKKPYTTIKLEGRFDEPRFDELYYGLVQHNYKIHFAISTDVG